MAHEMLCILQKNFGILCLRIPPERYSIKQMFSKKIHKMLHNYLKIRKCSAYKSIKLYKLLNNA